MRNATRDAQQPGCPELRAANDGMPPVLRRRHWLDAEQQPSQMPTWACYKGVTCITKNQHNTTYQDTAQYGGGAHTRECASVNARDAAALRRVRASARTIAEEMAARWCM